MKHKNNGKLISLFALLFLAFSNMSYTSYAGDLANDTVWTKRTDQLQGFSSLQFIKNDAVIVAQASSYTIFYDAFNGNEIKRIFGVGKPIFFNNDNNFLRLNGDRKKVEIFDTESYQIIGELESDDLSIGSLVVSKDENLVVGVVTNGLRVWDLNTKKKLRTKTQELNESLKGITIYDLAILPNKGILAFVEKDYKIDSKPQPVTTKRNILFDFETLDSIADWGYKGYIFKVSPTGQYIAYGINGVEIFSLETGELISNIKGLNDYALTGIEFSNDESYNVTSSTTSDDLLAIWDLKTGKQLYEYPRGSISCFDLSKDNKFIVNASGKSIGKWKVTEQMTSVSENKNQTILFPNPTNNSLEIKYQVQKPSLFQFEIINLTGQTIIRNSLGLKNVGENFDVINVNNIPLGQYNLKLYSETEQYNFMFIKGE